VAILELAETRAIARSLRFAGYGVEYCSAEEVSHLENGGLIDEPGESDSLGSEQDFKSSDESERAGAGGNDSSEDFRLTSKQLNYIKRLARDRRGSLATGA
jgi:hypothetical protein